LVSNDDCVILASEWKEQSFEKSAYGCRACLEISSNVIHSLRIWTKR